MLDDQTFTERQQVAHQQPGTCLHCHASVYVPYRAPGSGDLDQGFRALNPMPYAEARKLVSIPSPASTATIRRRCTARHAARASSRASALQRRRRRRRLRREHAATRQEMRTYVCGQCHVEYYFKGPEKRLTYPWAKGLKADEHPGRLLRRRTVQDWTHAESGAPTLKAQHPEFEMWSQGIHARSRRRLRRLPHAVSAGRRDEGQRPSRAEPAAQHQQGLSDLPPLVRGGAARRVDTIQDRTYELRNLALDALVELVADIKKATQARRDRCAARAGAAATSSRAVPARLHRGRELTRLGRALRSADCHVAVVPDRNGCARASRDLGQRRGTARSRATADMARMRDVSDAPPQADERPNQPLLDAGGE